MKRMNIALSENVHIKAKVAAVLKNVSVNKYILGAITEQLEKDKSLLGEKI
jgi:predicted HicB family RNase H-like nuclease